jgi:enoyl-CoA hydratase/carnithine racemase
MSVRVDRPAAGVLRIALDRPAARNAVDRATADGLLTALGAVEPDVGAVVLGSTDPGIFCAGADLKVPDAERAIISDDLYEIVERMVTLPVPVVAAISGPAVGGGAHLAVAADLRVAGPGAVIRVAGPGHGLAVAAWALPGIVGRARATDLCLTMREVNAPEALSIGLADRLADDPGATAIALAAELATLDRAAAARVKRLINEPLLPQLRAEREGNRTTWTGSIEGLAGWNGKGRAR